MNLAIVDPGSFVLPYDYQLVRALAARGDRVDFYGSTTRYNGEFLAAMAALRAHLRSEGMTYQGAQSVVQRSSMVS